MSITVSFTSGSKRENSTKQLTMSATESCTFKNGCSMLKPTLLLELNSSSFPSYTGFAIDNKYYKITDIRSVRNNLFEIDGEVDVLATYKAEIGASTQYVTRSASAYDTNIVDTIYPTKTSVSHSTVQLPNIHNKYDVSSGEYVIGVKSADSSDGVAFYAVSPSQFASLAADMFNTSWLTASDISVDLQKLLVNPMQYIVSVYWYPFQVVAHGGAVGIKFGFWQAAALGRKLSTSDRIVSVTDPISLPNHPQILRGNYLNASPYTRIILDAFAFGRIPIDANMFLTNRSASVQISVDVFTGIGEITMESVDGRVIKQSAMVGVPIQISQITQDMIRAVTQTIRAGGDALSKNYIGALSSIGSAIESAMPQVQSSGSIGSMVAYNKTPYLNIIHYNIADEHQAQLGRPLCSPKVINTLSGYVQCENPEIDIAATSQEKYEIIDYMKRGFFYE